MPQLPDTVQQVAPGLRGWVDSLLTDPTAVALQDWFAVIEVVHFLGLFALAACVIVTSLRLIGVGLVEVPVSAIWRNTRLWLHVGVATAIGSGLLMGLSNAGKLYNNTAFFWKMIALIAAIVFSYAVMAPAAKADGKVAAPVKAGLVVGMGVWAAAILVMLTNKGANVGVIHVLFAAALIVGLALKGWARWLLAGALAVLIVVLQVLTHVVFTDPFSEDYMSVNRVWMWGAGLFVLAMAGLNIVGLQARPGSSAASRLVGYASILVWVTVGAGGRWIGYT
jgi:hypothetical protein